MQMGLMRFCFGVNIQLCYQHINIVLGEGDRLHSETFSSSIIIPGSEKIIAIYPGKLNSIFIATEFRLFQFKYYEESTKCKLEQVPIGVRDRVLAVLEENECLWVVLAHGNIQKFTLNNETQKLFLKSSFILSNSDTVFYSASIVRRKLNELEIAYGTIFSGILVARLSNTFDESFAVLSTIYSISGHKGTVFSVLHHPTQNDILISCSDDRLVKVWKVLADSYDLICTCSGHDARVWTIDAQKDLIASVSEDNSLKLWNLRGELVDELICDGNSKSLWSVSINSQSSAIAISSNDGSVQIYDRSKERLSTNEFKIEGGIKYFKLGTDGSCFLATEDSKLLRIGHKKNFSTILADIKIAALEVDDQNNLFICDNSGKLICVSDGNITQSFSFNEPVGEIFVHGSVLLVQLKSLRVFLLLNAFESDEFFEIKLESKVSVTSFLFLSHDTDSVLIGTRQGILLVYSFAFDKDKSIKQPIVSLMKSLTLNSFESIKALIVLPCGSIAAFDRSGSQFLISSNFEILEHKQICKGQLEGQLQNGKFIYYFYQKCLVVQCLATGSIQKIPCGGGHRLWRISSDCDTFTFSFIINRTLTVNRGPLSKSKSLRCGSHGKEIRCASVVAASYDSSELLISGSEDGLLSLKSSSGNIVRNLRFQNVSIKCVSTCFPHVFVGGSNQSIEVLKIIDGGSLNDNHVYLNHLASCPKSNANVDTRVLSIDCVRRTVDETESILILTGHSDASIRIHEFFERDLTFNLLLVLKSVHQDRCVQQVRFISSTVDDLNFISAGADGALQAWKFDFESSNTEMLWNHKAHASGINCIDIRKTSGVLSIISGGDDGFVSITQVENQKITSFYSRQCHVSSVSSVCFLPLDDFRSTVLSVSIDRSVVLYNSSQKLQEISRRKCVISDISAITLDKANNLTVYGMGQESFILQKIV
jgi:WD40 repeat protein